MNYECECGKSVPYWDELMGQRSTCPQCGTSFTFPLPGQAPPAPVPMDMAGQDEPVPSAPSRIRTTEASSTEDQHYSFGESVESAYVPGGERGNRGMIFGHAVLGAVFGILAMAGLVVGSIILNVIHNILPVFIFLLPIVILGMVALAPAMVGMMVGNQVASVALDAKSRNPGHVGRVSCLTAVAGLAIIPVVGGIWALGGESFFDDLLLPFVRLMVGGSISFEWAEEPEPVNVPAWIIYGALGLSGLGGLAISYIKPSEAISWTPFCESCEKYKEIENLWKIPPSRAEVAARALEARDSVALGSIPYCTSRFKNRVCVELWACPCGDDTILELIYRSTIVPDDPEDKEEERDPVRLYSKSIGTNAANEFRSIAMDMRY